MNQLSDIDRGWVAGLFEGEGSFVACKSGSAHIYPRATMTQKDRDVLARLQAVTGLGTITGPRPTDQTYYWSIGKRAEIADFAGAIYPLLSERRQGQLHRVYERCGRDCPCV